MLAEPDQVRKSLARSLREKNCSSTGRKLQYLTFATLKRQDKRLPYAPIGCNWTVSFISPERNAVIAFGWKQRANEEGRVMRKSLLTTPCTVKCELLMMAGLTTS